jgi:hypothetical protein
VGELYPSSRKNSATTAQAAYKNTPTTHPPKKLLQFDQQQSKMPKSPHDITKLLQLDQQQKGLEPNNINMEVDVDVAT